MIRVQGNEQSSLLCRALLDTCATANFITQNIVNRLKLSVVQSSIPIKAIGNLCTISKGLTRVTMTATDDSFRKDLTCIIVPEIADSIPSEPFPRDKIEIPSNIRLADPEFHLPRPIDVMIGAGSTLSLFSVGQINLSRPDYDLYLQKTRLGWVVAGAAPTACRNKASCQLTDLESCIMKFWEMEEFSSKKSLSQEQRECESHFINNVTREENGRYTVRLPFQKAERRIGESRASAYRQLLSLERRLNINVTLKNAYKAVMTEYIELGHMTRLEKHDDDGYYMPHHAVIKDISQITKVRVVFNASSKTINGTSLNELLMVGLTIQDKLFLHLIRLCMYQYVLIADIEKMYRQVLVHAEDLRYQRILWRQNNKIETYQLNTLTFGVSSAAYLAIRVLHKLADDERMNFPRAAEILQRHLYVDDFMSGANTIAEAIAIRNELIMLLSRGGFIIRQWAFNDECIIDGLDSSVIHKNFIIDADRTLKTLDVSWKAAGDKFYYVVQPIRISDKWTKRNILSEIAKIFDPIGLLGPIILHAKRIVQDLWRSGVHWDESVPQAISTEWITFVDQMSILGQITFDRKIIIPDYRES